MRRDWRGYCGVATVVLVAACDMGPTNLPNPAADSALVWINQHEVPLASLTPTASSSDLAAFTTMVGSARIIGLGEATHGSREFFTVKDRLLRELVQNDGVTGFAMEATMPEAFAIDTYVRTGVGDPAVLLSHLYFWSWNTQEVADLIAWLRQWNQQHPANQVGFYGFDMQYPGVAIDSVISYVQRVAPGQAQGVTSDYACLADYRNDSHGVFAKSYSTATPVWTACGNNAAAAYDLLKSQHSAFAGASSERDYSLALQMANLVLQWQNLMITLSGNARDDAMAANIGWLLDREGARGKLAVWAHDYHISRYPLSMGWSLAAKYGADYLPVGFAFSSGGLNAYEGLGNKGVDAPNATELGSLGPLAAPPPVADSYEALLGQALAPNYYIDLRQPGGDAHGWFNTGHRFRSVGAVYWPEDPEYHYTTVVLPTIYDVMFFIHDISPSTLLPFRY